MRERIEKFAVMPFTISCATPSSTAIKDQHIKKPTGGDSVLSRTSSAAKSEVKYINVAKNSNSGTKNSLQRETSFSSSPPVESSIFTIPFSKSLISNKLQRFFKGLRALTQLFVYKEEEMQIGYPTDVKHVAHIGWDGSSGSCRSWIGDLRGPANHSSANSNDESELEQPRCSSWIEDAPSLPDWTPQDLLGTLGLHPPSPQFNLFKAAEAKAEKAKSMSFESKKATSSLQMM
ncbi:hypothetical protein SUGI_0204360 [Cryptomeria japonica]|uniref:CRIB domain-containing protein RIC10 n=1 Tax=Cryptomeria japonica TaxID=3369 RepID=UPI002408ED11|nr:CRIB domain-containing protein RIC10 [Cryptomeria japonica]XP_057841239.2 CRIB domain-containing protein RIC10 [Cryptomeria japonica]GLJ13060.1 hypothetical protein SUGI_0204360 [Cryptomeria japonica]